jgi:hypothetical protein
MAGKPDPKDEKWVKEKGKPFHPHPNVWRRRGLGTKPAAQGTQQAAGPAAAVAAPAANVAMNTPIVPIVLFFIAIIFLALNIPTGGVTLFLGFIVAVIGIFIAYKQRAKNPKNPMVLFGLLMNCAAVGAVILVIITAPGPGPNPGGGCSSNNQCANFGNSNCGGTSTREVECGSDALCHCAWGYIGCTSTAALTDPSLYCDPATGVAYFKNGGNP